MKRNIITETIVLKNYRIGEIHKGIVMISPEIGLFHTIAHGAYKGKSRMAGITDPFCHSLSYLYFNPVKNSYTLKDIEGKSFFEGIRTNLRKFYISSLWAEIILKSFGGGGGFPSLFSLFSTALLSLDKSGDSSIDYNLIQFLYKYIIIAGFQPDIDECGICGRTVDNTESLYFSGNESFFVCCLCPNHDSFELSPGGRSYLKHTAALSFPAAVKIRLNEKGSKILKEILIVMIQGIIETPLNTILQRMDNL